MSESDENSGFEPPPTTEPGVKSSPASRSANARRYDIPLPFQPFPIDQLPEAMREIVVAGASAIGCDPSMIALPTLSVLASCIGNSHRIQLKRGWTEPSCIWTVVVIESGKLKSPAFDQPLSAIQRRQAQMFEKYARELREFTTDTERYKRDARGRNGKRNGRGESHDDVPPTPPICERLACNDVTIEALADRLSDSCRGLLVARDELAGFFSSFDQYKSGKGADVALWLELHRGGPLTVDRKSSERKVIHIPRALVSITGGIQPEVLIRVLGKDYFANGLAARFLLAMPPFRQKKWNENEIADDVQHRFDQLVGALLAFELSKDPDGRAVPHVVELSPDAKAAWVKFYDEHGAVQAEIDGDLAAAFSKLEGYAARFALIFHLIGNVSGASNCSTRHVCGLDSIRRGISVARWFCSETERIYAILNESTEARDGRRLVELIERKGGSLTARDLQHGSRKYPNAAQAEAALDDLVTLGIGMWYERPTTGDGGRPTRAFVLHPPEKRRRNRHNPESETDNGKGCVGFVDASGDAQTQCDGDTDVETRI